jgi:hypothetical protein
VLLTTTPLAQLDLRGACVLWAHAVSYRSASHHATELLWSAVFAHPHQTPTASSLIGLVFACATKAAAKKKTYARVHRSSQVPEPIQKEPTHLLFFFFPPKSKQQNQFFRRFSASRLCTSKTPKTFFWVKKSPHPHQAKVFKKI